MWQVCSQDVDCLSTSALLSYLSGSLCLPPILPSSPLLPSNRPFGDPCEQGLDAWKTAGDLLYPSYNLKGVLSLCTKETQPLLDSSHPGSSPPFSSSAFLTSFWNHGIPRRRLVLRAELTVCLSP